MRVIPAFLPWFISVPLAHRYKGAEIDVRYIPALAVPDYLIDRLPSPTGSS